MDKTTYTKRFAVQVHQRVSRYELEDMRAYSRLATALMAAESEKHTAHVDTVVDGMSETEREAYFDTNSDTHELMLRRFPNQQQQSLVVLTYTVIETRLIAVARSLLRDAQPGLLLKDLAGDSSFKKARMVITKVAGLIIEQRLWDSVEAYRLVRNAIVHNAGELPSPPPPLVQRLLDQYPDDIQYSNSTGLVIKPNLIMSFVAACETLLDAILVKWLALEDGRTDIGGGRT